MMVHPLRITEANDLLRTIDALVTNEGTISHPYVASRKLVEGRAATRNLADAVHFFSLLHGRHPGLMDFAAARVAQGEDRNWAEQAVDAFGRERAYLAALAVGAGPMPSTAGQHQCETTVIAQGHAIDMLGQSERNGCALGAAIALALDWRAIRAVLDAAAQRLDVKPMVAHLPDLQQTMALIAQKSGNAAVERALLFGAQQMLSQHRGLWDMLAMRESVREETY